mgnify:CR=1 FL=1
MAKQISISDEVFRELSKMKKGSFSETIKTLFKDKKKSGDELIEKYAGKIPDFDEKEFFEKLEKGWKSWKISYA